MATKVIELEGSIAVQIKKHRRARRMKLTIHRDGRVLLTLPWYASVKGGLRFIQSKKAWIIEKHTALRETPARLPHGTRQEYQAKKEAARRLIETRLALYQKHYGVFWKQVRVGNQKSRWGSCSKNGVLSFTYRLLFLPEHLCDYVIVHELCHLRELNHSERFWSLVAETMPDYRTLRKELRLL